MTTISNLFPNGDTKRIGNWIGVEAVRLSKLRQSGLIASNTMLDERAAAPGNITSVPFFNPLDGDSGVGSDNLATHITPGNLTGDELLYARQFRTKAWAGAELAGLVTGLKPLDAIASGVASWRARDEEKQVMAYLNGVRASAIANDAATMTIGSITANLDAVLLADAAQTKGERKDAMSILIVHSAVHNKMVKDNQVVSVPASDQNPAFETYQGKRLIVSDSMVMDAAGVYCSILAGPGAFAIGETAPARGAVSVVVSETAGNGAGGDTLIVRRNQIMGVQGYSYVGAAVQGGPDNTALALAASHTRKYDAALIPLVFIKSKV